MESPRAYPKPYEDLNGSKNVPFYIYKTIVRVSIPLNAFRQFLKKNLPSPTKNNNHTRLHYTLKICFFIFKLKYQYRPESSPLSYCKSSHTEALDENHSNIILEICDQGCKHGFKNILTSFEAVSLKPKFGTHDSLLPPPLNQTLRKNFLRSTL